ncbi:single-stranded-DNA-specific exonuclease [Parabacteroides sp. PFB2-10]|uniref:single-stranded-DNA-specific exonuclease RecJ n=1 Tax=Parabacteroides sp. PFB2-10 TaxID=1742405 RepID=UPI00247457C5|nr:single-stranded-DNA-specific exonuclease RecJ [Parabacteroides sp. PFB2-10]MDH6312055.1 single-stranded-DNA-specific exonuclease [Parabacteroides sp. PFB2-10]MDL2244076.1 single-stranded-DNA-specific exonuclease RecJ [Parabacteroides sp. OttesenSCG-928-J18]
MTIHKWNLQTPTQEQLHKRDELATQLGISPVVALLLIQRGISSVEEAKKFFKPNLKNLHDPFLMPDMDKAVKRLNRALGNKEKILVYGDYDVDGTTAVALVYKYLRTYTSSLDYYIPDRYDEGYGISYKGIDYAAENGVGLIISLDCGIKAIDKIEYAKQKGIDFIICDHHMPDDTLPDAVAVLDAKRTDSTYPYEHLSGCGVGFKFMHAFALSNGFEFKELEKLLDLTAVSIASDIVPITGENRILAYYGLRQLNTNPSHGLKGIIDICGLTGKEITMSDIVFKIGPRINASGRMENGKEAVDLLLTNDIQSAREKSEKIDQYNNDRRELDKRITDEANAIIDDIRNMEDHKAIVVYNPEWHKGVIGIVASRLTEKYYRPAVVLTQSSELITGSARSITGFDIYKAIESCRDLLENFGGHTYAAGLSLKPENLEEFKKRFTEIAAEEIVPEQMVSQIDIDAIIELKDINQKLMNDLKRMNPFGPDNQKPVFCSKEIKDFGTSKLVGKDQEHIKLDLIDNSTHLPAHAIAFGKHAFNEHIKAMNPFDICYTIEENTYNGNTSIQLMIKDIKTEEE